MKPKFWLLAAIAALTVRPASARVEETAPLIFHFGEPAAAPTSAVSFRIPKYTLSPTERELVAACLVLEAANQGDFGLRSVMAVIRNRARGLPELFAPTVLREKQFSALNNLTAGREPFARTLARAQRDRTWPQALAIVDDALNESWQDPTGGATHYTRAGERAQWTTRLAQTVTIGGHSFYR